MDLELEEKIRACRNKILENNSEIECLAKENDRLIKCLLFMLRPLPSEKKERYDKELASDNWKKYSTRYINSQDV